MDASGAGPAAGSYGFYSKIVSTEEQTSYGHFIDYTQAQTDVDGSTNFGLGVVMSFNRAHVYLIDNFNNYGIYSSVTKTGADDQTAAVASLYGTYSAASNTGSTAGTKNTYGGYFSAAGETGGTSTK